MRRKKSFLQRIQYLAKEFASLIELDPWHITIKTELFEPFTIEDSHSIHSLKESLVHFLKDIRPSYENRSEIPFVFIKNKYRYVWFRSHFCSKSR